MSNTDSTAWLHINQRCGGDCIYCQLKEAKARIKELEAELAEEIFVSDAAEKRIAELEARELGWTKSLMELEAQRIQAMYALEKCRMWNGSGYDWHPTHAKRAWEILGGGE